MDITIVKNSVLAALSVVGSVIANWLGGWDAALAVLISMMVIDFLTGLAVAFVFKKSPKSNCGGVSSAASFKGLTKKVVILILIGMAAMLDTVLGVVFMRTTAILFYIGSEGLSILENTALMGVPYPSFIKKALDTMKEKGDSGDDDTGGGTQ